MLGVPGLMEVYMAGRVALANAPGTGVADDKVVYAYVPKIVKYYLGEDIILPNVPTYICAEESDRRYVLENIATLVVKAANESGGYGMLVGPHSSTEEQAPSRRRFRRTRETTSPSRRCRSRASRPSSASHRRPSRRPAPVHSLWQGIFVLPGGLTRVALKKGSLVVNSSQGGGSKDTWVLAGNPRVETDRPDVDAVMTQALRG